MLPSYEDCLFVSENHPFFVHKMETIDGILISTFAYRLASGYETFSKPVEGSNISAFEMRGIVFVHNDDNTKTRYPAIRKFFNLNQNEMVQLPNLMDEEIECVQNKEDGSLIIPFLVDGEVKIKTILSFENEQTELAYKFLEENPTYVYRIKKMIDSGIIPFFEIVSPKNRIVLKYEKTELRFISAREIKSGLPVFPEIPDFISANVFNDGRSLSELYENAKTLEDMEGFVVTFKNGGRVKIKTDWYFKRHAANTQVMERENIVLNLILGGGIDDVLPLLTEAEDKKRVENLISNLFAWLNKKEKEVKEIASSLEFHFY